MKKIILLLALFTSLNTFAQNFAGENVELLKGKSLKVLPLKENLQKYGYSEFYKDAGLKQIYKKSGTSTAYKELAGKEFKLVSYESYTAGVSFKRYKFTLENPETGTIYYSYDPSSDTDYPFEVIGGLDYPEGYFCKDITPYGAESIEPGDSWYEAPKKSGIRLVYHKSKFQTLLLHLSLPMGGRKESDIENKGVVITFDNGATIVRPDETVKIDARITSGIQAYKTEEVSLLRDHIIVNIKLGNVSQDVNGFTTREYVRCLLKK